MRPAFAAIAVLLCLGAAPPELEPDRRYGALDTQDQEAMARRLLLHVPMLEITVEETDTVFGENPRTGFGVVLKANRIVALSLLFQDAKSVSVVGPKGRVPAKILLVDHERRVAVLEPQGDLRKAGLYPVTGVVPPNQRKVDMSVFALVSTLQLAGVSQGVLTDLGTIREYGGYPRIDLKLERGMPVFDDRARFLGHSRVVAWDQDRHMIVPVEMVRQAQTATAAPPRPPQPKKAKRPWWAK